MTTHEDICLVQFVVNYFWKILFDACHVKVTQRISVGQFYLFVCFFEMFIKKNDVSQNRMTFIEGINRDGNQSVYDYFFHFEDFL